MSATTETIPIHTMDVSVFAPIKKEHSVILRLQKHGAFKTADDILAIDQMVDHIRETSKNGQIKKKSISDYLGYVKRFLKRAGHENCGMTEDALKELLLRYEESLRHYLNDDPDSYNEVREQGGRDVIPKWLDFVKEQWDRLEKTNRIYDQYEPQDQDIQQHQNALIAVTAIANYNSRGNMATLVNAYHPEADLKKDNLFIAGVDGDAIIIWNERKRDRIRKGKAKAYEKEDEVDTVCYPQAFSKPPYDEVTRVGVQPDRVGKALRKFYHRFRKNEKYVFSDDKGKPLFDKKEDGKIRYDRFDERIYKTTSHRLSDIRRSQATHFGNTRPSPVVVRYFAERCHHSNEEQNLYYSHSVDTSL